MKKRDEFAKTDEIMILSNIALEMEDSYLIKKLRDFIMRELKKTSKTLIGYAIEDGYITERKIAWLIKKYGVEREEIAQIFKQTYDKGIHINEGDKKHVKIIMVTTSDSGIWKMREYIEKNYGMMVLTPKEALEKVKDANTKMNKQNMDYVG